MLYIYDKQSHCTSKVDTVYDIRT